MIFRKPPRLVILICILALTLPMILDATPAHHASAQDTFNCSNVSLSSTTAQPGTLLAVDNVPANVSDFYAIYSIDDEPIDADMYSLDGDDTLFLISPFYLDNVIDGGEMQIRFEHNGSVCNSIDFTVESLDSTDLEMQVFLDDLQNLIDIRAAEFGVDRDFLITIDPNTLPIEISPLAVVQFMIDHPENPTSLRNLVDEYGVDSQEVQLAEIMIHESGLDMMLFDTVSAYHENIGKIVPYRTLTPNLSGRFSPKPDIDSPEDLHEAMVEQAESAADYDTTQQNINNAALLNTVASSMVSKGLTKAGAAVVSGGASLLGMALLSLAQTVDYSYYLKPNRFTQITGQLRGGTEYDEDSTGGEVYNVNVIAVSNQWSIDKALIDALINFIGATSAAKTFSNAKKIAKAGGVADDTRTASDVAGDASGRADVASNVCGRFGSCSSDKISFGPYTWRINLEIEQSQQFAEISIAPLSPNIVDFKANKFEPREVGGTKILLATNKEKFGGRYISADFDIEVKAIDVRIVPRAATYVVPEGEREIITINVRANNATSNRIAYSETYTPIGNFQTTVPLTQTIDVEGPETARGWDENCNPPQPNSYDIEIEAISLPNDAGAQRDGEPERKGSSTITIQGEIEPAPERCQEEEEEEEKLVYDGIGYIKAIGTEQPCNTPIDYTVALVDVINSAGVSGASIDGPVKLRRGTSDNANLNVITFILNPNQQGLASHVLQQQSAYSTGDTNYSSFNTNFLPHQWIFEVESSFLYRGYWQVNQGQTTECAYRVHFIVLVGTDEPPAYGLGWTLPYLPNYNPQIPDREQLSIWDIDPDAVPLDEQLEMFGTEDPEEVFDGQQLIQ